MRKRTVAIVTGAVAATVGLVTVPLAVMADQVILDDLIVDGSVCAGFDCVNGESFGFDTLRLKENNLRIRFVDTSSTASFPSNDWQITANDSSNGGANKFSIDDIDGGRTPFTIEANAPSHSLYVDDGGRLGLGTSTPVVDVHVKSGNTPTLRLEQDGTSGFTPQTWDVAGNETNFFIRDATNGSTLPFRLRPSAPTSSIDIAGTTGFVGFGESSPDQILHAKDAANPRLKLEATTSTTSGNQDWDIGMTGSGDLSIRANNGADTKMRLFDDNKVRFNPVTAAPGTPNPGDLYVNNAAGIGTLCVYDGTTWQNTTGGGTC